MTLTRSLGLATAVLWVTGIVLVATGHDLALPALLAALVVGLGYCLLIWWRHRRDPDGPSLLDLFLHQ